MKKKKKTGKKIGSQKLAKKKVGKTEKKKKTGKKLASDFSQLPHFSNHEAFYRLILEVQIKISTPNNMGT